MATRHDGGARSGSYEVSDPVVQGVLAGNRRAVSRLIGSGSSVNRPARHPDGQLVPLIAIASQNGDKEMVALLLDRGADINASNSGRTALTAACFKGFLPIVHLLVQRGAEVNQAPKDGSTALMCACQEGFPAIVQFLLEHGADFNMCDHKGISALFRASKKGHAAVVDLLLARGCLVDQAADVGCTPLHIASFQGHEGVVRSLLAGGASASLEDDQGRSPIDYAMEERHAGVRRILQQHLDSQAPCTQLALVSASGSDVSDQQLPQASACGPGQSDGASRGRRAPKLRFKCHSPEYPHSEASLQRRFAKCGRCRSVRYPAGLLFVDSHTPSTAFLTTYTQFCTRAPRMLTS